MISSALFIISSLHWTVVSTASLYSPLSLSSSMSYHLVSLSLPHLYPLPVPLSRLVCISCCFCSLCLFLLAIYVLSMSKLLDILVSRVLFFVPFCFRLRQLPFLYVSYEFSERTLWATLFRAQDLFLSVSSFLCTIPLQVLTPTRSLNTLSGYKVHPRPSHISSFCFLLPGSPLIGSWFFLQ